MFFPDNDILKEQMKLGAAGLVSTTVIFRVTEFDLQIRENIRIMVDEVRQLMLNIMKEEEVK